jgi:pimeloyl-ACP methyl ester carboxylesterase
MLPCVIYLHGNCSSRLEALDVLEVLLPLHVTVFAFDFAGSGLSDGEYISLGWFEREDLAMVLEHLRFSGKTNHIGLWGRSMGAVTALLYAPLDPDLAGLVLDSPFSSLPDLAQELASSHTSVPAFLISAGMSLVRNSIKKKIGLDINDLKPIHFAPQSLIPSLFICAEQDTLVLPYHTRALYSAYAGRKKLISVPGEHNGPRPQGVIDQVQKFFCQVLRCHSLPSARSPAPSGFSFHSLPRNSGALGSSGGFTQVAKEADVNELLAAMLEEIKELREMPESVDLLGLEESVKVKGSKPQQSPNLLDL